MKKFFTYPVFLILFLSFIGAIGFGSLLRHHYLGGEKFKSLQTIAITIAEIPVNFRYMIKYGTFNLDKIEPIDKHKNKQRFVKFIENKRNALLVLPRYEHSLKRSVVDIIDLNNFEVIHTYMHDINQMNNQVKNTKEFPRLKIDRSAIRFSYQHPLLLEDGSLISIYGPVYKLDFCSKLKWINDEEDFHHSQMLDHEGNIWVGGRMNPKSQFVINKSINFYDDSIIKINSDGEILFNKSIIEILIENNLIDKNIFNTGLDPIHLNDIEPAFEDTEYWQKNDLFISIRNQSAIIHYRPNTNKVINYITGPFAQQHDVDIISDKEISIFNNNNFFDNDDYSEVLIYNFKTNKFTKLFNNELKKENFKTTSGGLSHIFEDKSLMVEEQNHGRLILFNKNGKKEWEYVNKDKNGDIGYINWSRIVEDKTLIEKFRLLVRNKEC